MRGIRSPGSRRGLVWDSRGDCVGTTVNPGTDHISKLKVC